MCRLESDVFGGIEQLVVTNETSLVETAYLVAGGEAVEQHLVEAQHVTATGVVLVGCRSRLLEALATGAGGQVDAREVTAAGNTDFLFRCPVVVPFGSNFRAVQHSTLRNFLERRRRGCRRHLGHGEIGRASCRERV